MLGALDQYVSIYQSAGSASTLSQSGTGSPVADSESKAQESKQKAVSRVQTLPGQDKTNPDGSQRDTVELSREAEEIRELQQRDREVRAHEAAHAAAGGAYAGAPTYTFKRGPDGQTYAVGGEVSIDISPIKGDPQATLQKAQQVRTAALAPAEPSAQDIKVAQKAQAMAADARIEISQQLSEDLKSVGSATNSKTDSGAAAEATTPDDVSSTIPATGSGVDVSSIARLSVYS